MSELLAASKSGADEEGMVKMEASVAEANQLASKAARRVAKALAKAEDAVREAEALGAKIEKEKEEDEEPKDSKKPEISKNSEHDGLKGESSGLKEES
jgi:hypothetical protein